MVETHGKNWMESEVRGYTKLERKQLKKGDNTPIYDDMAKIRRDNEVAEQYKKDHT